MPAAAGAGASNPAGIQYYNKLINELLQNGACGAPLGGPGAPTAKPQCRVPEALWQTQSQPLSNETDNVTMPNGSDNVTGLYSKLLHASPCAMCGCRHRARRDTVPLGPAAGSSGQVRGAPQQANHVSKPSRVTSHKSEAANHKLQATSQKSHASSHKKQGTCHRSLYITWHCPVPWSDPLHSAPHWAADPYTSTSASASHKSQVTSF